MSDAFGMIDDVMRETEVCLEFTSPAPCIEPSRGCVSRIT